MTDIASWMNEVIESESKKCITSNLKDNEIGSGNGFLDDGRIYNIKLAKNNNDIDLEIGVDSQYYNDSLSSFGEKYSNLYKEGKIVELIQSVINDLNKNDIKLDRLELTGAISQIKKCSYNKKVYQSDLRKTLINVRKAERKILIDWLAAEGITVKEDDKNYNDAHKIKASIVDSDEYKIFFDPTLDRYEKAVIYSSLQDKVKNGMELLDISSKGLFKDMCIQDPLLSSCL